MNIRDLVHPAIARGDSDLKFAPKFNFAIRCKILALVHLGYPPSLIGQQFNCHVKTILAMKRESSLHYKALRKHRNELGPEAFENKYVTPEDIDLMNGHVAVKRNESYKPKSEREDTSHPSKSANQRAGIHVHKGAKFTVTWMEAHNDINAGWFYIDASNNEEFGPHRTSKECYDQAVLDINLMY